MNTQVQFDFAPGLLEQFPEFMDCVRASYTNCGKPPKHIAADCDMTLGEFGRKMAENPNDPVHFPLRKMPDLIAATGDTRPIQWLILTFMQNPEAKRQHALEQMAQLAPIFANLAVQAGLVAPVKMTRSGK